MRMSKRTVCTVCALVLIFLTTNAAQAISPIVSSPMRIGSRGPNVRILQQNLLELRLYNGVVDGMYGGQTAAAVKKLQARYDLPADGVCGYSTMRLFNGSIINETTARAGMMYTQSLQGKRIGIDAGHQKTAELAYEPIAPDSLRSKERMSPGVSGIKTGVQEYEITLLIAKKLQSLLERAGAVVIMTRTQNDVELSNAERAQLMNDENVDCWVRIHCDSSSDRTNAGIHILAPSEESSPDISEKSGQLADLMLNCVSEATGAQALSVLYKTDQTGFNYSSSPVITAELGYLSNPVEDVRLNRSYYQQACAIGMYNGLAEFFDALE